MQNVIFLVVPLILIIKDTSQKTSLKRNHQLQNNLFKFSYCWKSTALGWKSMKKSGKPSRNRPRKRLGSVTEAPWLGFSSRKQFFSLILSDSHIPGGLHEFVLPSFPCLQGKRGRWLPPSSPKRAGCFHQKALPSIGTSWKAQVGLIAICTPLFTKYTPSALFYKLKCNFYPLIFLNLCFYFFYFLVEIFYLLLLKSL